ncbi:MAG: hypothetical protein NVV82_12180 [Sporocytophaga sp.]|nr:hypothetical protein [Sporocytophaga sp.]
MLINFLNLLGKEIDEELNKHGYILLELKKANTKDWNNSPFESFTMEPAILINGSPTNQSFYRKIKYKKEDQIVNAWVEIKTSPFKHTEIQIKDIKQ